MIIRGRIFWHEAFNNPPGLELLVDHVPKLEEFRFEQREDCYYGEKDGICSFFSWGGRPDRGYGGRTFTITMKDGSTKDLVGPWSSSPTTMNAMGFGPCTDAALTADPADYERGFTLFAAAVTMSMLGEARDRIEVPPYKFSSKGEHWRGFDRRFIFPQGSRFTMVQTTPNGKSMAGPVKMDRQPSSQQGLLLGQMPTFLPLVELPNGGYWLKPTSHKTPMADIIPAGAVVEERVPETNEWLRTRSYVGGVPG